MLRREGEATGINRIYRLYREEGLVCAGERGANVPLACVPPFLSRQGPMPGGHSTSCMTRWPMAGGSGF